MGGQKAKGVLGREMQVREGKEGGRGRCQGPVSEGGVGPM